MSDTTPRCNALIVELTGQMSATCPIEQGYKEVTAAFKRFVSLAMDLEETITQLRAELSAAKEQLEEARVEAVKAHRIWRDDRRIAEQAVDMTQHTHPVIGLVNEVRTLRADNARLTAQLSEAKNSLEYFYEEKGTVAKCDFERVVAERNAAEAQVAQMREALSGPANASYEYDPTPTAEERITKALALSTPTGLVRREVLEQCVEALRCCYAPKGEHSNDRFCKCQYCAALTAAASELGRGE